MNRNVGKGMYLFLVAVLAVGLALAVTPAVFAEGPAPSQPGAGASGLGQVASAPKALPGTANSVLEVDGSSCQTPDSGGKCDDGLYKTIQAAINAASDGDTINVAAGTYTEIGQIVIAKNLTITGVDRATTIIKPAQDTGSSGDSRGWFLVNSGITFNLSHVTLDGQNKNIMQGIRSLGNGVLDDIAYKTVIYPGYNGVGVVIFGQMTVSNSTFQNMGRIGVIVYGATATGTITGNTYTGKGTGDWLDYAFEAGGGGKMTVTANTITNCKGVATSDGSTSAGILVTTFYGGGTTATIENNFITGNTGAVADGYDATDTSAVTVHDNDLSGNVTYAVGSTAPKVDASGNWWGSADPATVKLAADNGDVEDYTPWLAVGTDTNPAAGFQGDFATLWVDDDSAQTGSIGRIQEGINMVSGSTVNVAAGMYRERLTITKPLILTGAGVGLSIIDATSFETTGNVIDITALTGNTKIEKFDIKTGDHSNGIHSSGGTDAAGMIEILNNHIISTNFDEPHFQFGIIAGYGDVRKLLITGNEISNTYNNSILVEKQGGETQITGNTLNGAYPTIWFMTYDGMNVAALQKVSGNTIDMSAAVPGNGGSGVAFNPSTSFVAVPGRTGKYDNVEISNNVITGLGDVSFKGISVGESSTDGIAGGVTSLKIFGNTVSGTSGKGIQFYGHITGADIHNNVLTGLYDGIKAFSYLTAFYPENNAIYRNQITGASNLLVEWAGTTTFDVEENWWGSSAGPNSAKMSANVDYSPWCLNAACTATGTQNTSGELVLDSTTTAQGVQDLLNSVSTGTVIVLPATTLTPSGGFTISTPGITIKLSDGTVIQASSPCFTVDADNTSITGGVCIPSGGAPGIQVNTPRKDVVIRGIEIKNAPAGSEGDSDGIHVGDGDAGDDVTNLQILDTYIHGNAGDGVEFDNVDLLGVFEMRGNAFRTNAGVGVRNTSSTDHGSGTIDAKYNEWGAVGGPGVLAGVATEPWVYASAKVIPVTQKVREAYEATVTIKGDFKSLLGAQFRLSYDTALLTFKSLSLGGGAFDTLTSTCQNVTSAAGVIEFRCSRSEGDGGYDATSGTLASITFTAKDLVGAKTAALTFSNVKFGAVGGVNIYFDAATQVTNGAIEILATSDVTGRVDLQGRRDDNGATFAFGVGSGELYNPGSKTTDYWGAFSFKDVTEDTYAITVSMNRYLDVTVASGRSRTLLNEDSPTLSTLVLLGGDADDSDEINILDASIIGGQFGKTPPDDPRADINNDGIVDILDLVLVGGNFDKQSKVATDNAYAAWTP
jgi:hypothetical protein